VNSIAWYTRVPPDKLLVILKKIVPASHLTVAKNPVFLTSHLAGTGRTNITTTK